MAAVAANRSRDVLRANSDVCTLVDLVAAYMVEPADRDELVLEAGWVSRWSTAWQVNGGAVLCPVRT